MADPSPGQDSTPPSLVFQEITSQADLAPSGGVPPAGIRRTLRDSFRALRHRNFRLFVTGQMFSLVGTWMQNVAQAWLVYRLTHSAFLLGAAWFCTQLPVFALGPLGGLASDRYSRYKIVILTQTFSMLQAFVFAALTLSGRIQVWEILALAATLGTINAFDMPGRQSLIIHMTNKEDLLSAISLNSAIFNTARIAGPAIAGILVALVGEGVCFLLNGISFLAVIGCLLAMRLPKLTRGVRHSPWSHLVNGFRYAFHHEPVRSVLYLLAAMTITGMPAVVLMPVFADAIFHRGAEGLGFLTGAMGVGAVFGTLVLAAQRGFSRLPRVIFYSAATTGICFMLFSMSSSFYLSLFIMPVIGFSAMRQTASANTVIQSLIPDEYRGRIMALYTMTVVGLGPFGSLAAGAVAHVWGVRLTVLAGGILAVIAALIFRLKLPQVQLAAEES